MIPERHHWRLARVGRLLEPIHQQLSLNTPASDGRGEPAVFARADGEYGAARDRGVRRADKLDRPGLAVRPNPLRARPGRHIRPSAIRNLKIRVAAGFW